MQVPREEGESRHSQGRSIKYYRLIILINTGTDTTFFYDGRKSELQKSERASPSSLFAGDGVSRTAFAEIPSNFNFVKILSAKRNDGIFRILSIVSKINEVVYRIFDLQHLINFFIY